MPLFIVALALAQQDTTTPDKLLAGWGVETVEMIRRDFYIPSSKLYAESFTPGEKLGAPAFNWGVGVMLSALNSAARLDPKYQPWLVEYADASHVYWNSKGPVAGYDVLPSPKPVDRYYDDNAWMVMGLVETYEQTEDPKYLKWAEETLAYVFSGEDKGRGGIYWRETEKSSRNTCSNAPAAAASLAVFRQNKKQKHLVDAIRIYNWTKKTLQDPADHLMWDNINNSGKVDKTKWSYNTALMIRSAAHLYALTKNPRYLEDLKLMQGASAKRWLTDALKDDGRFAHLLMESWLEQREFAPVRRPDLWQADYKAFLTPMAWLHVMGRSPNGRYGKRFDSPAPKDQKEWALIDQASAARSYLKGALYYRTRP